LVSRVRIRRGGGERGFTLIELLVALAIAAIAVALFVPSLTGRSGRAQLAASAHEIAASLRLTRSRAIAGNRPELFAVDVGDAAYLPPGAARPRAVPRGIRLRLITTEDQQIAEGLGTIRFFPDGSSTGGGVALDDGRDSYAVLVDWSSGAVSIHAQAPTLAARR
jgi:general secretion pathway protein H